MLSKDELYALISPVRDLMVRAADTFILPRFSQLSSKDIQEKSSPNDLVTIADIETEQWLTPKLSELLPGSLVVGEEAASSKPCTLEFLAGDNPVWIIDPIDGTCNFANGHKDFVTMLALVIKHKPVLGMIWRPLKRQLFWGIEGKGAWCQIDSGREIPLAVRKSGTDMARYEGYISHKRLTPEDQNRIRRNIKMLPTPTTLGCAGEEYIRLASGHKDYAIFGKPNSWDHAPGIIILREAGGFDIVGNDARYTTKTPDSRLVVSSRYQVAQCLLDKMFSD